MVVIWAEKTCTGQSPEVGFSCSWSSFPKGSQQMQPLRVWWALLKFGALFQPYCMAVGSENVC